VVQQAGEGRTMNRYRTYLDDRPKPLLEDPGAKIAQDIKAYLAKGGKITDVPTGYSKFSDVPMRSWINESRMRKLNEGKT
jgi:hypothetical protein